MILLHSAAMIGMVRHGCGALPRIAVAAAALQRIKLQSRWNPGARMSTEAWSTELASIPLLLQGRHITIPDDIKSYVEDKMADAIIERSHMVREVDVRLSMRGEAESGPRLYRCEATLFTKKHGVLRAEEDGGNMHACVDNASRLLGKKLLKLKDKLGLHGRLRSRGRIQSLDKAPIPPFPTNDEEIEDVVAEAEDLAVETEIIREKFFDMLPMRPEDALEEMKNIGHDFYAFRNVKTLEINVLYKRKEGGYGLIGPTAITQKLEEDPKT
ncbi:ribosome-binding factor PSRP1, chloroplastic-like [Selaginella moellendorffii]|uniref:ribosome-binding factor PSRP1, chloroplastic-like n=1 Tax=Selaginella moellendorffii TaxID=88036 RepID=UPI000D1C71DB|nr:ribosome-binding factor PSRP1, chloroplastic-like [Selaginella moellendorffii]|eukprot:XP_024526955.1 ribosome-binding factor PSRP1, chloroplastic-like [Selaginella moellendorffii]